MSDTRKMNSAVNAALGAEDREKYEALLPRTKDFRRLLVKVIDYMIDSKVRAEESVTDPTLLQASVAERKALRQVSRAISTDLNKPLGEPSD